MPLIAFSRGRFWWCMTTLLLLELVFLPSPSEGAVIAKSQLQKCLNDGSSPMTCDKKLVVTLTVDANQKPGAEVLNFISTAADTEQSGAEVSFEPIALTFSRSAVYYRYPVFYIQDFNAQPYEETIKGTVENQCSDSPTKKATCGLNYADGVVIPYSQGYCCSCGMCSAAKLCSANARAAIACNIFGSYSSAACLRFGEVWYSGFSIGSSSLWFTMDLTFSRTKADGTNETTTLVLSPESIETSDESFGVYAQIIGTFSPTVSPAYFSDKYLFAPSRPLKSDLVLAGASEYMIVQNTLVTPDGSECNKVGVSYYAFNAQGSRCQLAPGSCLRNQLSSLRESDRKRVDAGLMPVYLASGHGDFLIQNYGDGAGSPYLTFVAQAPPSTMITVTMNADDLEYVVAVADGVISETKMNQDVVEADSRDALLDVRVKNVGSIVAMFTLNVNNCSGGVFPIPSRKFSLEEGEELLQTFNIYCQEDKNQEAGCQVSLQNAVGEVVDTTVVTWQVKAVDKNDGSQGGRVDEDGPSTTTKDSSSCQKCNMLNLFCILRHFCFSLLFAFLIFTGVCGGAVVLLFIFRRQVWRVLSSCFSGCRSLFKSSSTRSPQTTAPCEPLSSPHTASEETSTSTVWEKLEEVPETRLYKSPKNEGQFSITTPASIAPSSGKQHSSRPEEAEGMDTAGDVRGKEEVVERLTGEAPLPLCTRSREPFGYATPGSFGFSSLAKSNQSAVLTSSQANDDKREEEDGSVWTVTLDESHRSGAAASQLTALNASAGAQRLLASISLQEPDQEIRSQTGRQSTSRSNAETHREKSCE